MVAVIFLRPALAWHLLWVLPLLALGIAGLAARARDRRRLLHPLQLARALSTYSPNRAAARLGLAALAAVLIALSAAGPVVGHTRREVLHRGLDIVVCIDTSRSMLAEDLRPSRMERARREVVGLLHQLRGDRVALLAFSGDVRDVSPLTHDVSNLEGLLEHVTPDDNRLGGTDLGAALERALELFDGRSGAHEAVVLITDGEDLSGRGLELAQEAADRGIRVYVVGVGTEAGSKIPTLAPDGREAFVVGPDGEEVVTRLGGETLRELARATGGEYLSTADSPTPLEELYAKRMAALERQRFEGSTVRVPHDRFQYTLALAVLCLLAEAGLRERRGPRLRPPGGPS